MTNDGGVSSLDEIVDTSLVKMHTMTNGEVPIVKKIVKKMQRKNIVEAAMLGQLVLLLLACGCDMKMPAKKAEVIEPAASKAPSVENDESSASVATENTTGVLVTVNGQPLYMKPMYDALLDDYGLQLARQFIADELVQQELVRQGLSTDVTKKQIALENRKALHMMFKLTEDTAPQDLDKLRDGWLEKNKFTLRQWNAIMRRNVGLTRLAANRAKVSDEELREEFLRRYNAALRSRHIQVPTLVRAEKILKLLKQGQDFTKLAYKYSTNPSAKSGAWLPEIGTQTAEKNMNTVLVQVIRSLQNSGDYSGAVQVGTNFHIVRLEEKIPPKNVKFDDVRDELRAIVLLEKTQRLQREVLGELFQKAKLEYVEPSIRKQVEQGKK